MERGLGGEVDGTYLDPVPKRLSLSSLKCLIKSFLDVKHRIIGNLKEESFTNWKNSIELPN